MYFDINLKLLSGKNTKKVNKQNIWDSQNWVFDELNEIYVCFSFKKIINPEELRFKHHSENCSPFAF